MTLVYVVGDSRRQARSFHKETCGLVRSGPGATQPVRAVELSELKYPRPCLKCFPDAPRAVSWHRRCEICRQTRPAPCAHNGGVLVKISHTTTKPSVYRDASDPIVKQYYVWPENAHYYQ